MVFYLKYRPQKIEELDSKNVRDTLHQVLALPEIPHAFLFTGPKGLGKTSAARILAKAVNCEKKLKFKDQKSKTQIKNKKSETSEASDKRPTTNDQLEPCNSCESCISITNGTNLDIQEIDAASNRGIDEIRDLREKIKLTPLTVVKKVYIIDEVHMLTTEAFNALLKTLEEPPVHAMFILCTTELQKVPATILSRCFHVPFQPASIEDIGRSFKRISEGEGLTIEADAIEAIAEMADGGFRDAHKLLEELVSMGEKVISSGLIEKRFKHASSKNTAFKLMECLQQRDSNNCLKIIQSLTEQQVDLKQFVLLLTEIVHQEMLVLAGVPLKIALNKRNIKHSELKWTISELRELLILLNRVFGEMKSSVLSQLPLELAVIEWSDQGKLPVEKLQPPSEPVKNSITSGVTVNSLRKQAGDLARVKALYGEPKVAVETKEKSVPAISDFSLLNISNTEITKQWQDNFWLVFIQEIKQYNHTIAGVLRSCVISRFDKDNLEIMTAYKFHKEKLDNPATRDILEQVCKTLTGKSVRVEVILKDA